MLRMDKASSAGIRQRKEEVHTACSILGSTAQVFKAVQSSVLGGMWADAVSGTGSPDLASVFLSTLFIKRSQSWCHSQMITDPLNRF